MKKVGSYEAKTHLSRLLDEISQGETISITKKGVPVAMLVPFPSKDKPDPKVTIQKLRAFRKGISLGRMSIRDMMDEGRRF